MFEALLIISAIVSGGIVALRFIAPRTKSKRDDALLEYLEYAQSQGLPLVKSAAEWLKKNR